MPQLVSTEGLPLLSTSVFEFTTTIPIQDVAERSTLPWCPAAPAPDQATGIADRPVAV